MRKGGTIRESCTGPRSPTVVQGELTDDHNSEVKASSHCPSVGHEGQVVKA